MPGTIAAFWFRHPHATRQGRVPNPAGPGDGGLIWAPADDERVIRARMSCVTADHSPSQTKKQVKPFSTLLPIPHFSTKYSLKNTYFRKNTAIAVRSSQWWHSGLNAITYLSDRYFLHLLSTTQ